ncbi:N-terminal C2 in EEIG1 and EHBP1 proteins-domain-containing protein [Podospora fimiseda]|uniref:N-terminal C2 in EEIG1 and EHBP1 proteins-domain-containing protein n=1 Tax=Podospora fimiseda TaxID=252190 RepID=A0AAN7BUX8_9PEZI|nr:N-terminal C2 in EEIG1 and EHBP1 proteins-domain-containing protein [Podospora fimiseda]
MASLISKARKPKFDVHLKIYDLNNVPLVSGMSMIKWHLPHSIHSEHRGRTNKCPIQNHRVEYNYSKIFSVRIGIDRSSNLVEYPIEFEVLQEFSTGSGHVGGAGGRDEKITLGTVKFNLSEYVEESEAILRDGLTRTPALREILASPTRSAAVSTSTTTNGHRRKRSSLSNITIPENLDTSPRSSRGSEAEDESGPAGNVGVDPMSDVQDGVVRRYLMQDSKINSTLKISILMVQVDGERNYAAPAPKSAPVFGGIAGFVAGDALAEPVDANAAAPTVPTQLTVKSRDVFELQDMYRRALAASWASQPTELPADQCIEDIFAGGDGFRKSSSSSHHKPRNHHHSHSRSHHHRLSHHTHHRIHSSSNSNNLLRRSDSGSLSDEENETPEEGEADSTLRPRDITKLSNLRHHFRHNSGSSDGTAVANQHHHNRDLDRESSRGIGLGMRSTVDNSSSMFLSSHHRREESKITHAGDMDQMMRSRSSSLATMDSLISGGSRESRGGFPKDGMGFKRVREVDEFEVREDLVAWTIPV